MNLVKYLTPSPRPCIRSLGFMLSEMETLIPQITRLLNDSFSSEKAVISSATDGLDHLSRQPQFSFSLLAISNGGENQGLRIAAATYLKNFIRRRIEGAPLDPEAHHEFRNKLAQAVLQAEPAVLKVLVEAFRVIIANDFVKDNSWPELVPEIKSVIQSSNIINQNACSQWNTINALTVLQTIVRPFQYFLNPKVSKEPVPSQLELIAEAILAPLLMTFHHLADKAISPQYAVQNDFEQCLLIICKCMYFTVRSYMPSALVPFLPSFCGDLFRILDSVNLDCTPPEEGSLLRLKTAKRSLICFRTLITRHRKLVDKLLPSIINCSFRIVKQSANMNVFQKLDSLSERILSLAFDVISHVLETGPGWRLVSPHFFPLLESAIFPALALNQKDVSEWEEDPDEYIRKNLPSDIDEISGSTEDLFTARKSAINLLGVIAMSKSPRVVPSASKRKKGDKIKRKEQRSFVAELLVLPFLSKFPIPFDGGHASSKLLHDYYGVLMAYGGLQDFLSERNSEYTATLVRNRVLPLYSCAPSSPYLVATANWVLGELASCLPEAMSAEIYNSLMKAFSMLDAGDIDCYPVHASAAGAIASLLENEYFPPDWLSLLQGLASRMDIGDENESSLSLVFQLLGTIVEAGGEKVGDHIPEIISSVASAISKHLPPIPDPWPQVVERGFAALAAMAQTWEDHMQDDIKHVNKDYRSGWAVIARALSSLLQQAWLMPMPMPMQPKEAAISSTLPPSSSLDDASSLLGLLMRFIITTDEATELKITELMAVWADMISDWHAWDEMEDITIFSSILEAVNLQQRCDLTIFFTRRMPSQNTSVSARSIIEGVSAFVIEAITAYPSATWRACSCVHALIHIPRFSLETDAIRQSMTDAFTRITFSRFKEIHDKAVGLWKPLLLVISSCYMIYPENTEEVLGKEEGNGFMVWVRGLAYISSSSFEPPLSSKSEIKLAVMTLAKVVERLLLSPSDKGNEVLQDCLVSLMESSIHLKEVEQQEEDGTEDADDEASEEETEDDDDDDDEDEDSDDDECEETEEDFLNRYAKVAEELESEMVAEGDVEDEVQELELGALDEVDIQKAVLSLIERHHHTLILGRALPPTLIQGIISTFPEYGSYFQVSC